MDHYKKGGFNINVSIATAQASIEKDFPGAVDQHNDRIDSWRSYNPELDGD